MNIKQAQQSGVNAYHEGRDAAPALNQAFLKAACESRTNTADLFDAYNHGWTIAMLTDEALPTAPSVAEMVRIMA